jgi:hypothetical protein
MFLKRVIAHAIWRELPTSVLETFCENFADFLEQESKWMFILYVLLSVMLPYAFYLVSMAKINNHLETAKKKGRKKGK